jgi:hypothetical protein
MRSGCTNDNKCEKRESDCLLYAEERWNEHTKDLCAKDSFIKIVKTARYHHVLDVEYLNSELKQKDETILELIKRSDRSSESAIKRNM